LTCTRNTLPRFSADRGVEAPRGTNRRESCQHRPLCDGPGLHFATGSEDPWLQQRKCIPPVDSSFPARQVRKPALSPDTARRAQLAPSDAQRRAEILYESSTLLAMEHSAHALRRLTTATARGGRSMPPDANDMSRILLMACTDGAFLVGRIRMKILDGNRN